MRDILLTTTSSEGLQPLGSAAQRSFELVSTAVTARLGAEAGAIFAEPVAAEHGDRIDWHVTSAGKGVPLNDLTDSEQVQLRMTLGDHVAAIRAEAEALAESARAEDQRLSEALSNALEIPGEDMIWAIRAADGTLSPVLVHWAWMRDDRQAVRGVLTAMIARPAPIPTPVAATGPENARGHSHFWWWLILLGWIVFAGLVAAILYLLIAPCGVRPGGFIYCPREPVPVAAAMSEAKVAADEVAALEREIALLNRQCHPSVPVQPLVPETGPAPDDAADNPGQDETRAPPDPAAAERRVTERGGQRGKLNFVLEWASIDDIDLAVTCPTGVTVSYQNRGDCDGELDLDANVLAAEAVRDPVENIVFDEARPGIYKVRVHLKSDRTQGEKPVTLHVFREDGPSRSYQGIVGTGQDEWITHISISR